MRISFENDFGISFIIAVLCPTDKQMALTFKRYKLFKL